MYLPDDLLNKDTRQMAMDEFMELVALAHYARNMRINDIEAGMLRAMEKILT